MPNRQILVHFQSVAGYPFEYTAAHRHIKTYFELMEKGVNLVSAKEGSTDTYKSAVSQSIAATGNGIADIYIEATNRVIKLLAEKQIWRAFEQSEKEVEDLHQRT